MSEYKYTAYFENEVLRKRSYLQKEWCIKVIEKPINEDEISEAVWMAISFGGAPLLMFYNSIMKEKK